MSYLRASNAMPIKYKHFCLSRLSRLNSSTPQLHNSITLQHRFQFWIWSWYTQMPIACNALTDSKLSWKRNGSAQSSPDTSRHAYINLCKWVCVCAYWLLLLLLSIRPSIEFCISAKLQGCHIWSPPLCCTLNFILEQSLCTLYCGNCHKLLISFATSS